MTLHVFALNEPVDVRLTDLTRARGEIAELPPLAQWLGVEALDTDRVELFPVSDLEGMGLDQYLLSAYDVEARALSETAERLRALDGAVLILPDAAMTGAPRPGPQATQIAVLPVAKADHSGTPGKAEVPPPAPEAPREASQKSGALPWVVGLGLALAALIVWVLS